MALGTEIEGVRLYTLEEALKKLHMTDRTLKTDIKNGLIKTYKISYMHVFTDKIIDEYKQTPRYKKFISRKKKTKEV